MPGSSLGDGVLAEVSGYQSQIQYIHLVVIVYVSPAAAISEIGSHDDQIEQIDCAISIQIRLYGFYWTFFNPIEISIVVEYDILSQSEVFAELRVLRHKTEVITAFILYFNGWLLFSIFSI